MLHRVRELRAKTKALLTTIGNEWEQTLENVFVESFEVHVRNLVEFFKSPPNRSKRMQLVHADNFLGSSEEETWRKKNVTADDIELNMWEKICFLSVLAASNCLFRANIGEIVSAPGGRAAIERALDVNFEIATREGHPPRAAIKEFARKGFADPASKRSGSMLHDVETGAPVEADHIIGWMLERAQAHGLDANLLSLAYTNLKAYEARRNAGRLP